MRRRGGQAGSTMLARALKVLDAIMHLDKRGGVSLQQIAEFVGQNRSTVYRWLQVFCEAGLVEQVPLTQTYRLGLKVFELYGKLHSVIDFRAEAAPILVNLMEETGETVNLGIYDRGEVLYLEKLDGPRAVVLRSWVGARLPVHCTALGKALLAHQPGEEIDRVLSLGLKPKTPQTILDADELLRCLEEVRLRGYAVDDRENEDEVRCVAAPVFDHTGRVVAAISVSGLTTHIPLERIPRLGLAVRTAAERLSARLGYQLVAQRG